MPHWYRQDDDPEHILELDPVSGKFVPQSVLRAREEQEEETVSSHAKETRKPWAGETRPNLIRLFPPPDDKDPIREAKISRAILEAKNAQSAPDIVPSGSDDDEEVLQLVFYCDGSIDSIDLPAGR